MSPSVLRKLEDAAAALAARGREPPVVDPAPPLSIPAPYRARMRSGRTPPKPANDEFPD